MNLCVKSQLGNKEWTKCSQSRTLSTCWLMLYSSIPSSPGSLIAWIMFYVGRKIHLKSSIVLLSDWIWDLVHWREFIPDTVNLLQTNNCGWGSLGPLGESSLLCLAKLTRHRAAFLNIYVYIHRQMLLSPSLNRRSFISQLQQWTHRHRAIQGAWNTWQLSAHPETRHLYHPL